MVVPPAGAWPPAAPPPVRRPRTGLVAGLIAGAVGLLVAASLVLVIADRSVSADGGWLTSDLSGAVFLQLTEVDGAIAGSAQTWRRDDEVGPAGSSESFTLTGLRSDDSLSITLEGPLGASLTWTGELRGDELTLQIASDDGGLRPATFRRATVEEFNAAVEAGQREAGERQGAAQELEEAAAEQERVDDAVGDASRAEQQVVADLERLDQAIDELDAVGLEPQIDEMERRLDAMRVQLDRVLATSECIAQSDALVALGDGLVALGDADVAFRDARLAADDAISRAEAVIDDLDKHTRDLEAAIERGGPAAPTTTVPTVTISDRRDAARSSIDSALARAYKLDEVADGLLAEGEAVLAEGQASIRTCSADPSAGAPTVPDAPSAPNAPSGP